MSNTIELAKSYVPMLDEVYKIASLTSDLDGNPDLVSQGANAGELIIPVMSMDGLGDYSRNSGYVDGDVSLTNKTIECNFDRGRMFNVDNMDNMETAGLAYGRLAGEFIRTKVTSEEDAFRFASYAGVSGISKISAGATLADGAAVSAALRVAVTQRDEDEVPVDQRYLYITPPLLGYLQDMDTTKSREVLQNFAKVQKVPQTRFYTAIDQKSGKVVTTGTGNDAVTTDETAGGYAKATAGKDINFMIIHKPALIQFTKHVAPKIITPEVNQSGDAYKFGYRKVSIAKVYANKAAGIYLHHKAT